MPLYENNPTGAKLDPEQGNLFRRILAASGAKMSEVLRTLIKEFNEKNKHIIGEKKND